MQVQNTMQNRDLFATQTVELNKVVKLFTGPNSKDLHARHIAALDKICQAGDVGAAIRDLPKIEKILQVTFELIQNGLTIFEEPVMNVIRYASRSRCCAPTIRAPMHCTGHKSGCILVDMCLRRFPTD